LRQISFANLEQVQERQKNSVTLDKEIVDLVLFFMLSLFLGIGKIKKYITIDKLMIYIVFPCFPNFPKDLHYC